MSDSVFASQINLQNLTELWRRMGAKPDNRPGLADFQICNQWPYRAWTENSMTEFAPDTAAESLAALSPNPIVPIWEAAHQDTRPLESALIANGFDMRLPQTAMNLDFTQTPKIILDETLVIRQVTSDRDAQKWVAVASAAFQYEIDLSVIQRLLRDDQIELWLAWQGRHAAASALTLSTGTTVGVHQMGVQPCFRGRGLAREMMAFLMQRHRHNHRHMVLQASSMGEPLYRKLGFQTVFAIRNYQRN